MQDLSSMFFELAHIHRICAYTVCQDAAHQDLYCSPTANAVGLVIRELPQCLDLTVGSCLDDHVSALQLVKRDNFYASYVLITALLNGTLDI